MVRIYDSIERAEILQTLSVKLSWSHLIKLITIEDTLKREFYITMCVNERWSVRTANYLCCILGNEEVGLKVERL